MISRLMILQDTTGEVPALQLESLFFALCSSFCSGMLHEPCIPDMLTSVLLCSAQDVTNVRPMTWLYVQVTAGHL